MDFTVTHLSSPGETFQNSFLDSKVVSLASVHCFMWFHVFGAFVFCLFWLPELDCLCTVLCYSWNSKVRESRVWCGKCYCLTDFHLWLAGWYPFEPPKRCNSSSKYGMQPYRSISFFLFPASRLSESNGGMSSLLRKDILQLWLATWPSCEFLLFRFVFLITFLEGPLLFLFDVVSFVCLWPDSRKEQMDKNILASSASF